MRNFFFIPPLCTLAGLLQRGEFFHSRTTLAVGESISEKKFKGLEEEIDDSMGILLIVRDPLFQAELFSQFLAKPSNIRIIKRGKVLNYGGEIEREVVREILITQAKAAIFYRGAKIGFPLLQRKAWRKVASSEEEILTETDPGMVENFKKAWESMNSPDNVERKKALVLFKDLVDSGYVFRSAKIAQTRGIQDREAQVRIEAIYLLEKLKEKKQISYEQFRKILRELRLGDPDDKVKEMARSLRQKKTAAEKGNV